MKLQLGGAGHFEGYGDADADDRVDGKSNSSFLFNLGKGTTLATEADVGTW